MVSHNRGRTPLTCCGSFGLLPRVSGEVDARAGPAYCQSMRWRRLAVLFAVAACLSAVIGETASAGGATAWLASRAMAQHDVRSRFENVATASCVPDRSSASQANGGTVWWQRYWCSGRTQDGIPYKLLYKSTGKCGDCWTITSLTGTSVNRLRAVGGVARPKPSPSSSGSTSSSTGGSCQSGWYRNVDGDCVPSPSSDSNLLPGGPTAICRDGSYSYSQHHSGTCSHHGGVSRWL